MVMRQVCADLNDASVDADVVFILNPRQKAEASWQITSTRLIELRNEEKRALLAFIPPGLKVAAEDSFDVSTFAEINLEGVPIIILQELHQELPLELGVMVDRVTSSLRDQGIKPDDLIRYYLTVLKNKTQYDCAGGAIYQLGLVPDFALYQNPSLIEVRVARNFDSCQTLKNGDISLLVRIHNLTAQDKQLAVGIVSLPANETRPRYS